MDGLWKKAGGAWSSLVTKYPELDRLQKQAVNLLPALGLAQGAVYILSQGRRYKVVQQLGDGAYSTVYLVQAVQDGTGEGELFALKQVRGF